MNLRRILAVLLVVVALLATAGFAAADCGTIGKVLYVFRSGSYMYFLIKSCLEIWFSSFSKLFIDER